MLIKLFTVMKIIPLNRFSNRFIMRTTVNYSHDLQSFKGNKDTQIESFKAGKICKYLSTCPLKMCLLFSLCFVLSLL